MGDKSKSWSRIELITIFGAVVAIFFGIATLLNNQGNTHIEQQIINNYSFEQYEQRLKRRESEILAELEYADADAKDRLILELELSDIQQQLQNKTASYEEHIASLRTYCAIETTAW